MKAIKAAWIEQIIEFDNENEFTEYIDKLKNGRPQMFKVIDKQISSGKLTIRIRKQYNNNNFPE